VKLKKVAEEKGICHIAFAANVDDLKDYRPGTKAAQEMGIMSPLMEAGLNKEEIRFLSREMGLDTWGKPSMACLASGYHTEPQLTRTNSRQLRMPRIFCSTWVSNN